MVGEWGGFGGGLVRIAVFKALLGWDTYVGKVSTCFFFFFLWIFDDW